MDRHTISVILNYVAIAVVGYVYVRWLREPKRKRKLVAPAPPPLPAKQRFQRALVMVVFVCVVIGAIYGVPEWMGRRDATAVCNSVQAGSKFAFDMESLSAYHKQQKSSHGTLFAANYHPRIKGVQDGTGAIVMVFLAGFPFSRAYCVLNMKEGIVESTRLMFNAEDYEYCDGEMRGVWECKD